MKKPRLTSGDIAKIIIASIGALGVIIGAYFAFREKTVPVIISATQTAEERLLEETQLPASAITPEQAQTPMPTITQTFTPTVTLTFTPTPPPIVDTSILVGWVPNFSHSNKDNAANKLGINENALEITYDIGKSGYITVTKSFDSSELSGTEGISFIYMGKGNPNSLEFKLMLRYPGDVEDTTYGILWNRATDTNDKWLEMQVMYDEMTCWWPAGNCAAHGSVLDPKMVDRLDFAISNKEGDQEGSGWIMIKDVFGIRR
jgi:hypothetical protein